MRLVSDTRPAPRALTCPACGGSAAPVRSGAVEYDRCRDCGGVWLDRGELEQLLAIAYRSGKDRAAGPVGRNRLDRDGQSIGEICR